MGHSSSRGLRSWTVASSPAAVAGSSGNAAWPPVQRRAEEPAQAPRQVAVPWSAHDEEEQRRQWADYRRTWVRRRTPQSAHGRGRCAEEPREDEGDLDDDGERAGVLEVLGLLDDGGNAEVRRQFVARFRAEFESLVSLELGCGGAEVEVRWGSDPDILDVPIIVEHRGVGGDEGREMSTKSVEVATISSIVDASTETEPLEVATGSGQAKDLANVEAAPEKEEKEEVDEGSEGVREDPVADAEQVNATSVTVRHANVYLEHREGANEELEGETGVEAGAMQRPPMSDAAKEQLERIMQELAWAEQALEARRRWLRESKKAEMEHHALNEHLRRPGVHDVPRLDFQL